jgi:hypothetical protein
MLAGATPPTQAYRLQQDGSEFRAKRFSSYNLHSLLRRTFGAIKRQADIMEKQTKAIERQGLSMRRQTTILRNNVNALISSERGWIDGEIGSSSLALFNVYRYSLRIRNLGKTPAQIRSYRISTGPLSEGSQFEPTRLSHQRTRNLHVFVGGGGDMILEDDIEMDQMFPGIDDANWGTRGAFCVTITYADVIRGTPDKRTERETSFIYLYTPLLHTIDRLSQYNKYT